MNCRICGSKELVQSSGGKIICRACGFISSCCEGEYSNYIPPVPPTEVKVELKLKGGGSD